MPSKKTTAKPRLPLWFWAFGIVVLGTGIWISWPDAGRSNATNQLTNTLADIATPEATFTDYFDAGWRSGDTQAPLLVEATYVYPELATALEGLPVKSGHQGEIADRLAVLKPNTDTIVFYLTLASPNDEVKSLRPDEMFQLSDDQGNTYALRQWSEANALLLPASEVTQRIGLLAFSQTADNDKSMTENKAQRLLLAATFPNQASQTLTWDLDLLATFLQSYERNE